MIKHILVPVFYLTGLMLIVSCNKKEKESDLESGVSTVLPEATNEVSVIRLEYTDFCHELIANGVVSAQHKVDLRFQTLENVAHSSVRIYNVDTANKCECHGRPLSHLLLKHCSNVCHIHSEFSVSGGR